MSRTRHSKKQRAFDCQDNEDGQSSAGESETNGSFQYQILKTFSIYIIHLMYSISLCMSEDDAPEKYVLLRTGTIYPSIVPGHDAMR